MQKKSFSQYLLEKGIISQEQLDKALAIQNKDRLLGSLAKELGIQEYPTPSGGCLLTDPQYSNKLFDLFQHLAPQETRVSDIQLLQLGRHLRLSEAFKVVVGRDERENGLLSTLVEDGDWWFETLDHKGPLTIGRGDATESDLENAARVSVRYGKAPKGAPARVLVKRLGREEERILEVTAIPQERIEAWRMPQKFSPSPHAVDARA